MPRLATCLEIALFKVMNMRLLFVDEYRWLSRPVDQQVIEGRSISFTCLLLSCGSGVQSQGWSWHYLNNSLADFIRLNATGNQLVLQVC